MEFIACANINIQKLARSCLHVEGKPAKQTLPKLHKGRKKVGKMQAQMTSEEQRETLSIELIRIIYGTWRKFKTRKFVGMVDC